MPRQAKRLPVYPTLADVHRVMDACQHARDRMLVWLLWVTGARVSEVIALRAGDVLPEGIRAPNLKQRQQADKLIMLPPALLAELREYANGMPPTQPLIGRLHQPHKPISRKLAWRIVTEAGRRAGVLKLRSNRDELRPPWPHAYRHGNAVHMLASGVPVNAVRQQLGHSTLASTAIYLDIADPERRHAIAGVQY